MEPRFIGETPTSRGLAVTSPEGGPEDFFDGSRINPGVCGRSKEQRETEAEASCWSRRRDGGCNALMTGPYRHIPVALNSQGVIA